MTGYAGPPFGWVTPDGHTFEGRGTCASCGADIQWTTTRKGNRAPLDRNGVSHFATCPNAADHRRPKPSPPPPPPPEAAMDTRSPDSGGRHGEGPDDSFR